MFVTRRQFLLSTAGAAVGAIIPSFYFRALEYFERFGEPMLEIPRQSTDELIVLDNYGDLELHLGDPYEEPPFLTYREYVNQYENGDIDNFLINWDVEPEDLDDDMDPECYLDCWATCDSPGAQAYHLLDFLDLGKEFAGPNAVGGLDFLEHSNMVSVWNVVCARDELSLSLLQRRLNDLGTGLRIVTGYSV